MRELAERIKIDVIISAFICIALGIVLILWPVEVTTVVCKAIGAVIAFLGAVRTIGYILHREEEHSVMLLLGLVLLLVGIWIFLKPRSIQSILFIGIGAVLFVHGLEDFKYALEAKRTGYASWAVLILLAVLGMAFGIVCIVDCFGVISVTLSFVGAMLIYDGITDLWIVSRLVQVGKEVRKQLEAVQAEPDRSDAKASAEDNEGYEN